MAVAFKSYLGSAASISSSTTVVITTTDAIAVGDLVIVRASSDNLNATTPTFTCADSGGNTYTTQIQQAVNATGAAGVAAAVMATRATVAVASGGTITVTLSGAVVSKSAYAETFTGALNTLRFTAQSAASSGTGAASPTSSAPTIGDLVIGCIGAETRATATGDSDTTGGSWSTLRSILSAGSGSDAARTQCNGQYKIVTTTNTQTYNNTIGASTDWAALIAVFQSVPDPAITQAAFRFYDQGTESGSTALQAQDTNHTGDLTAGDGLGHLRVRLQSTTAVAIDIYDDFQLQWEKNANGSWTNVGTGAVIGYNDPNLTNASGTTNRLTGGSGSFVAGKISEDGLADDVWWSASNYTELLYSLQFVRAQLAHNDVVRFRVLHNAATTVMTYTVTPTVTVVNPPVAITQAAYRFYADGTESGSTALAAQDTAPPVDTSGGDVNAQLRVRLQSTSSAPVPSTDDFRLQWEKNTSGSWTDVAYPVVDSAAGVANNVVLNTAKTVVAQSFTGDGRNLGAARFRLAKTGSPTGDCFAVLYAHSGTFGSSSVPTGSPLATSVTVLANSSLVTGWQHFNFDGTFTLVASTRYCIGVSATTTGPGGVVVYRQDAGGHAGNGSEFTTSWAAFASDLGFEVHAEVDTVGPYDSSNLTDAEATTNRLGAGSGSFVAGKVSEDGLADNVGWTANNYTELLYSITLKSADLAASDTVRFRVLYNGATTEMTYTAVPTVTISGGVTASPATIAVTAVPQAATATGEASATATPDTITTAATSLNPTAGAGATAAPATSAATVTLPAATTTGAATAVPATIAATATAQAPSASGGGGSATATPATIAATAAPQAATATGGSTTIVTFDHTADEGFVIDAGGGDPDGIILTGSAATYETGAAVHGTPGVQAVGAAFVAFNVPNLTTWYGSVYMRCVVNPGSGSTRTISLHTGSGNSMMALRFNSSGALQISNASNVLIGSSLTTTWSTSDSFRFDWQFVYSSGADTVDMTVRVFKNANIEGVTPDETATRQITSATTDPGMGRIGSLTSGTWDVQLDTLRVGTDGWFGPFVPPGPTTTLDFEGGTDEAVLLLGGGLLFYDGNPPTYESSAAFHGALGATTTGAPPSYNVLAVPTAATWYGSVYMRCTAAGSGSQRWMALTTTAETIIMGVRFNSSGAIEISNASDTLIGSAASTTWTASDEFRFDWEFVYNAGADTVDLTLRIFKNSNIEGATADESLTRQATSVTTDPGRWRIGGLDSAGAWIVEWDTLRYGTVGWYDAFVPSGAATASPATIAATAVPQAPAATGEVSATATPASIAASALPVAVTTGAGATASPATIDAAVSLPAATAAAGATASPAVIAAAASMPAPTATGEVSATASPATIGAAVSLPAATAGVGATATPATIAAAVSTAAAHLDATLVTGTITAAVTLPAPVTGSNATASPVTIAAAATLAAVTTGAGAGASPATITAAVSLPVVSTAAGATATPAVIAATVSLPAPSIVAGTGATATPATISAIVTAPAATVQAGASRSPVTITVTVSLPAVSTIGGTGATATPATIAATAVPQTVTTGAGATRAPAVITATATLAAVTTGAGATRALSTITATATLPAATTGAGATTSPVTIAAAVSLPAVSASAAATRSPSTITAAATLPAATTGAGATATPATITVTVSAPAVSTATGSTAAPATILTAAQLDTPDAVGGSAGERSPASIDVTVVFPTASVSAGASTVTATITATATLPAVSTAAGASATPVTITAPVSLPAPTTSGGVAATATPVTITASVTLPAGSTAAGATRSPATITATASPLPVAASGASGATASPATITATATLPAAAASGTAAATASPATIAAVVTLPAASKSTGATASPATITATASLPAAAASGASGGTRSPATIAATVTLATPATSGTANVTASPVRIATAATFPTVTVSAGASTTPATIATSAVAQPVVASAGAAASTGTILSTVTFTAPSTSAAATSTPATIEARVTIPAPSTFTTTGTALPETILVSVVMPAVEAGTTFEPTGRFTLEAMDGVRCLEAIDPVRTFEAIDPVRWLDAVDAYRTLEVLP